MDFFLEKMLMNKLNGQQDCDTVTTKSTSPNSQQTPQQTISSTFTNSAAINNNSQQQEKSLKDCQSSIVMTSKNMQGATQLPNGLGSVGSNSSASSTTSSASGNYIWCTMSQIIFCVVEFEFLYFLKQVSHQMTLIFKHSTI